MATQQIKKRYTRWHRPDDWYRSTTKAVAAISSTAASEASGAAVSTGSHSVMNSDEKNCCSPN